MSEPYLGEIKMFAFDFPPRGWSFCDGQILPINQNQSLYSLLGTTYGGDGRTSFALPDLRGRTPLHVGDSDTPGSSNHTWGERSGEERHVLQVNEIHAHTHTLRATNATPSSASPAGNRFAPGGGSRTTVVPYTGDMNTTPLATASVAQAGGQGHNNMQPYLALRFCIALRGVYPSRN